MYTYPAAFVQTNVDSSSEFHEIALREFEGLEIRPEKIAILSQKVLEQVGVHGAAEMGKKEL